MRYSSIFLSLFLVFVVFVGLSKGSDNKENKHEEYEHVDPSELSFEIKDYTYDALISSEGAKPIDGKIGEFLCEGYKLELTSNKFEGGFIVTKNYGKIKIRFGSSLYKESFSIWLTPKQKKVLKALKSRKEK